jgi:hypothetical protein
MTAQERLQASISRINADRIAERITITLGSFRTMVSATTLTGVAIDEDWLNQADDATIDQILKHQLVHHACGSDGGRIADIVGDLGEDAANAVAQARAQHSQAAFSRAADVVIDATLTPTETTFASTAPAMPDAIYDYLTAAHQSLEGMAIEDAPCAYASLDGLKKVDEIQKRAAI